MTTGNNTAGKKLCMINPHINLLDSRYRKEIGVEYSKSPKTWYITLKVKFTLEARYSLRCLTE